MQVMMFDINPFKSFIDLIMDNTNTIELLFTQDELRVTLLNNSHICFYDAKFTKDYFDYYKINDVESILIDSSDLLKILKSAKATDELHMESNDSYLILKFESNDGKSRRIFELPLIDDEYNSPAPPRIDYDLDFLVDLSKLTQCVFDLDKIIGTDKCKIIVSDDGVSIVSPSDSMTNYCCNLDESITGDGSVNVNTNYISGLNKLSKISKTVELSLGSDIPLSWRIVSPMEDVEIKGLIAPIIEEE